MKLLGGTKSKITKNMFFFSGNGGVEVGRV